MIVQTQFQNRRSWAASIALLHWYGREVRTTTEYNGTVPGPYSQEFMPLVFDRIQKKYGVKPDTEMMSPPDGGLSEYKTIEQLRDRGHLGVVRYEACCLWLLYWLKEKGDIATIQINHGNDF
jgi:hypothetical protein